MIMPSTTIDMAATTFSLFAKLPLEVRPMVWEAYLPDSRVLNVSSQRIGMTYHEFMAQFGSTIPTEEPSPFDKDNLPLWQLQHWYPYPWTEDFLSRNYATNPGLVPIVAGVCQEARKMVLQSYELAFSTLVSPPLTYFDFERDIFYLRADAYFKEPMNPRRLFVDFSLGLKGLGT
jgi:hypothetical protein